MRGKRPATTDRARSLRASQTDAEARLWQRLRNRNLNGFKFVRQVAIGSYFADFACREARLVVEIDGATHATPEALANDARRTTFMQNLGYRVVRFQNVETVDNLDGVLETILAALERRDTV